MACKYYYILFIIMTGRVSNENKKFMLNLKKKHNQGWVVAN